MSRIRFITATYAYSPGETVRVVEETDGEVYFYDHFRRWCYARKDEEGISWEWCGALQKERDAGPRQAALDIDISVKRVDGFDESPDDYDDWPQVEALGGPQGAGR